ncbi:MAG: hypothetical protein GF317_24660, partial [Candidatus Lokiarchaeota archaeon]|nr:hypothetical protein [Candidatus Lokiarchaeota archaeon]MBD3202556.1 hypothetical protein [Candidatus Lokiarchaeota archaeon]
MRIKLIFFFFPIFIFSSFIMSYFLIFSLGNLLLGVLYSSVSVILLLLLIIHQIRGSKSETENLSQATIEFEEVVVTLNDGITTKGIIYRSKSETISTPHGRRYPQKRPVIVYFHGFWSQKEVYIPNLIALSHMGYIAAAFDQRGHGEAGGKKEEWYKFYNDVGSILDSICSFKDTKEGSICCIGTSMGGTSVLTKAYEDKRVAM